MIEGVESIGPTIVLSTGAEIIAIYNDKILPAVIVMPPKIEQMDTFKTKLSILALKYP